jgi:hypothetical protein
MYSMLMMLWLALSAFNSGQYDSIAFSMSSDGGLTWSRPIKINQTPTNVPALDQQAFNPTVAVAADGTVAVTYYDFRNNTPAPGALTDYWLASGHPSATKPTKWNEVRLTDTSFDLEQAATRFNGAFFLGDYDGLAAAGNDFVAVWGMPDATKPENIYFRRAISPSSLAPALAAPTGAGTAASLAGALVQAPGPSPAITTPTHSPSAAAALDPTLVALQAAAPALVAWAGPQQAEPSLVPQPTLTNAPVDRAPPSAGPSRQTEAESGRAAAHGTPSPMLDRVFADLDASLLLDTLQDCWAPGPTG